MVVGLVVLVGVVGVVVPLLPGSVLILLAVLAWSAERATGFAWAVFVLVTTWLAAGAVVKYVVPGRRLRTSGVPNRSLVAGGLLAIVGFFVIPVVGLVVGFVLGVYLSESRRLGARRARASTRSALGAVGLSLLIELGAALLAATTWLAGALLT